MIFVFAFLCILVQASLSATERNHALTNGREDKLIRGMLGGFHSQATKFAASVASRAVASAMTGTVGSEKKELLKNGPFFSAPTALAAGIDVSKAAFVALAQFMGKIPYNKKDGISGALIALRKELMTSIKSMHGRQSCVVHFKALNFSCCSQTFVEHKCNKLIPELRAAIMYNNKVLLNSKVKANVPYMCFPFPNHPFVVFCLKIYNVGFADDTYNACFFIAVRIFGRNIAEVHLECIGITTNGQLTFSPPKKPLDVGLLKIKLSRLNPWYNKTGVNLIEGGKKVAVSVGTLTNYVFSGKLPWV